MGTNGPLTTWLMAHGLSTFDAFVFVINLLIFAFSRPLVRSWDPRPDDAPLKSRLWTLWILNLTLFALYFIVAAVTGLNLPRQISQTGLTLLVGYLSLHLASSFILRRYGRRKEIEGTVYRTETYQSEVFTLLAVTLVGITCFLVILNVWELTEWLQATSVLGGLLVILYATKDVFAPDHINGLILLYNRNVTPGAVIRVPELDILGIALHTTLTQTTFKDLVHRHEVIVPNRRLRQAKIEVLSSDTVGGLWEHADFQVGYEHDREEVAGVLLEAWERARKADKGISAEKRARARLVCTGDHAVTWRLFYCLSNVYRLMPARFAILEAALDVSRERGISLATPLTHVVATSPATTRDEGGGARPTGG